MTTTLNSGCLYPPSPILIADDDRNSAQGLLIALKSMGFSNVQVCHDGTEAAGRIGRSDFELILLDLVMPGLTGEQVMEVIIRDRPEMAVIVVTGVDELETAVRCMRRGAFDYLVKPVSRERLLSSVQRAIDMRALRRENLQLKEHVLSASLQNPDAFAAFDSDSDIMLAVFRYAESIAGSPSPVLITGETGVGKEIMARCVHDLSRRKGGYVAVNVAGLDEQGFSDTLFGHRKGAFTGAAESRGGLVDRAAGGSLFLDEIGDLDAGLQIKLLRLLQEKEYLPLGADVPCRSDARIIVATNKALEDLKASDHFRKDLYFRLCHHHIHIPTLRERRKDLPRLINRFLAECAKEKGLQRLTVPENTLDLLRSYDFPGNVREVKAMIADGASQQKGGRISVGFFSAWVKKNLGEREPVAEPKDAAVPAGFDGGEGIQEPTLPTLKEAQEQLIEESLRRAGGNQAVAAKALGITRQALNRRVLTRKKKA